MHQKVAMPNVELVKKIKKAYQKKIAQQLPTQNVFKSSMFDINSILGLLPHRYPFVLVDRIVDIVPGGKLNSIQKRHIQ